MNFQHKLKNLKLRTKVSMPVAFNSVLFSTDNHGAMDVSMPIGFELVT
jgi:hypothetical protein